MRSVQKDRLDRIQHTLYYYWKNFIKKEWKMPILDVFLGRRYLWNNLILINLYFFSNYPRNLGNPQRLIPDCYLRTELVELHKSHNLFFEAIQYINEVCYALLLLDLFSLLRRRVAHSTNIRINSTMLVASKHGRRSILACLRCMKGK